MDIKDFSKNRIHNKENIEARNDNADDVKKKLEDFSQFSNKDLYDKFVSEVKRLKSIGELDSSKIEQIKKIVMPLLTDEQLLRFNELIKIIDL